MASPVTPLTHPHAFTSWLELRHQRKYASTDFITQLNIQYGVNLLCMSAGLNLLTVIPPNMDHGPHNICLAQEITVPETTPTWLLLLLQ